MKKLFIALVFCLTYQAMFAQDLIKPINGKSFFVEIQSVENGIVNYQIGVSKMTMPTTDVALIEFSEGGVLYFHEEALKQIDPNNIEAPVYKRGHKVYIPFSSKDVTQRSGALKLRELVSNGNVWEVADCKEEAHFILDFQYSEIGADGAVVNIKDRKGNQLVQTPKVKNSGWDPVIKGEEIARVQYEKYISKISKGELEFNNGLLNLSGRKEGLVIRPEVAMGVYLLGMDFIKFGLNINASINYQISPKYSLGAGMGVNKSYNYTSLPLYVNARAYFNDHKWSPFLDLKIGYHCPLKKHHNSEYDYIEINGFSESCTVEYENSLSGLFSSGTLGVQYQGFDFGISVGVFGTRRISLSYTENFSGIVHYYHNNYKGPAFYENMWLLANVAYTFQFKKR